MADIKTRGVTRGTIKTLDRTTNSMHHIKESTVRTKTSDLYGRQDDDANSYAQDAAEHYAGESLAYAAQAGAELIHRSRGEMAGGSVQSDENFHRISSEMQRIASEAGKNDENIQRAFKERGVRSIRSRQEKAKMADAEVLRNAGEDRLTGRIRRASVIRQKRLSGYSGMLGKKHPKPLSRESAAQARRKEYAIRRLTERNAGRGIAAMLTTGGRNAAQGGAARGAGRLMKRISDGSRTLLSSLSAGGAAAVVLLVIMVLFGAAFAMNEDGSYMTGSGDGTIVEVARGELGNAGGDKFWKWYGFSSHVDWCAIFVSWCADQCGYLEMGVVPKFSVVGDGANWFKARHRWAGRGYKPSPGDIIFFDFEQDGVLDHVGIVESCDGKTVTTIEGNSSNACKRLTYRVGSSQIAGYGLVLIPGRLSEN